MEKNVEVSLLFDFYGELLKPSCRQAIDLYYNEDLSLAEIAAQTGITRQGVRDSIKRSEEKLFELEKKLGLFKRLFSLRTDLTKSHLFRNRFIKTLLMTQQKSLHSKSIERQAHSKNKGVYLWLLKDFQKS